MAGNKFLNPILKIAICITGMFVMGYFLYPSGTVRNYCGQRNHSEGACLPRIHLSLGTEHQTDHRASRTVALEQLGRRGHFFLAIEGQCVMRSLHFITISRMRTERSLAASNVLSSGFSFVQAPSRSDLYRLTIIFVGSAAHFRSVVRPTSLEIAVRSGGAVPSVQAGYQLHSSP